MKLIFLSDQEIYRQVQNLCASEQSPLQIGVAYWGNKALQKTGLCERIKSNPNNIQVICDLESGSCNPYEIQRLLKKSVQVRTLKDFHAKVWISDDVVIVGSANASSNGLGSFGDQSTQSNIEAAVLVSNKSFTDLVRNWFDRQWDEADRAEDKIKKAYDLWQKRRKAFKYPIVRKSRYRAFFELLLEDLRSKGYPLAQDVEARPINYIQIGAGHTRVSYFARFPRNENISVELVINKKERHLNQKMYNKIYPQKRLIKTKPSEEWSGAPAVSTLQASIVLQRSGTVDDEDSRLDDHRRWMVEKLFAFEKKFGQFIDD